MNYSNNPLEDLQRLTEAVMAAHTDIAPTYLEYTQLAFAIATDCGEAGRASFISLCSQSAKYDEAAARKLFSNALRTHKNEVHLGTAFHLAEQYGVTVPSAGKTGRGGVHPPLPNTRTRAHAREDAFGRTHGSAPTANTRTRAQARKDGSQPADGRPPFPSGEEGNRDEETKGKYYDGGGTGGNRDERTEGNYYEGSERNYGGTEGNYGGTGRNCEGAEGNYYEGAEGNYCEGAEGNYCEGAEGNCEGAERNCEGAEGNYCEGAERNYEGSERNYEGSERNYEGSEGNYYDGGGTEGNYEGAERNYEGADGNRDGADSGSESIDSSEPYYPLPLFPQDYRWPAFLQRIIDHGGTPAQRDVLFLAAINVLGASLSQNLRCLYGHKWQVPSMQTFIVASSASGKGVVQWVKKLVQPLHDELREVYREQMKQYKKDKAAYESLGKARAKTTPPEKPLNKLFLIPANNSGTGILQNIIDSGGIGLICESEADTVSASIGADYGQWSHVLRQLFDQSDLAYNRRTEQEYLEVWQTAVSVLLSGTPAQVKPLIPSAENGLFSRELFYYMPSVREWVNQFFADGLDMDEEFLRMGREWKKKLDEVKQQGLFDLTLTQAQMDRFNEVYSDLFKRSQLTNGQEMASSVMRDAVNILRILSVVALLRSQDTQSPMTPEDGIAADNLKDGIITRWKLPASDADFEAVLALAEPLYRHSTHILSFLAPSEIKSRSTADKDLLFASMQEEFSRAQLMKKGKEMNIPANTTLYWLKMLLKNGKVTHGNEKGWYRKKIN